MGTNDKKPQTLVARFRTAMDTMVAEDLDAILLIIVMVVSAAIILVVNVSGYSW